MDSKEIFLKSEGDAYFERNLQAEGTYSGAARFLAEFLNKYLNISNFLGGGSYSKWAVREDTI